MRNLGGGSSKYSWLSGGSTFPSSFSPLGGKRVRRRMETTETRRADYPSKVRTATVRLRLEWSERRRCWVSERRREHNFYGCVGRCSRETGCKGRRGETGEAQGDSADALFALEYERRAGAGYGSGETLLYRLRAGGEQMLKAKET